MQTPAGNIAYAPTVDSAPLYNRRFEKTPDITFPKDDIYAKIAQLALQDGKEKELDRALDELIAREALEDRLKERGGSVVQSPFEPFVDAGEVFVSGTQRAFDAVADLFSPVQEFFAGIFSSEPGVAEGPEEENIKDTKLELVIDEHTLSPGDPTNVLWEVPETPAEPPRDPFAAEPARDAEPPTPLTPAQSIAILAERDSVALGSSNVEDDASSVRSVPEQPAIVPSEALESEETSSAVPRTLTEIMQDTIGTAASVVGNAVKKLLGFLPWF